MADENKYNIKIECGTDFVLPFVCTDDNGNPVDLTGATVSAQLREHSGDPDAFDFICTHNGVGGRITLAMPNEVTKEIPFSYGVYDVRVTLESGVVKEPLYGDARIQDEVTKPIDGTALYMVGIETYEDLPAEGITNRLYFVNDDRKIYRWNGTNYVSTAVGNGIQRIDYVDGGTYRMVFDDGTYFDFDSVPRIMGTYDATVAYDKLDVVHGMDGATYIAKIPAPAGTALSNATYWQQMTQKTPTVTSEDVSYDYAQTHTDLVTNTGTADAPNLHFKVPRGVTGNESIDDTAGQGDDDVVWSADKNWNEIFDIKTNLNNINYPAITTIIEDFWYPTIPFEIGAISLQTTGWTYVDNNKRIRTPEGKEFRVYTGDKITLSSYSGTRFYVGIRKLDETYSSAGWLTADYTVPFDGYCVLLIANDPDTVQPDVRTLASLVRVKRKNTLQKIVEVNTSNISKLGYDVAPMTKNLSSLEVPFERGIFTITSSTITYSNSTRAIRTEQAKDGVKLHQGDVIKLSDYTAVKMSIAYKKDDAYYGGSTYLSDYTCQEDGIYYIQIYMIDNAEILDPEAVKAYFSIERIREIYDVYDVLSYPQYAFDMYPIHGISHRGVQDLAPENTIPAFKLSVQNNFKFVETDVMFTSDNVPVLLHDPTINRTARNADGTALSDTIYINDITYAQALEYDFGIWKGAQFAGTKIPKFEDFVVFCKRTGLFPYLELKSETTYTQAQVNLLVSILKQYDFLRNVSWISYSDSHIQKLCKADKGCRVGRCKSSKIDNTSAKALNAFKTGFNDVFWSYSVDNATQLSNLETSIAKAKEFGQPIQIGVVSTEQGMANIMSYEGSDYISGCLSNGTIDYSTYVRNIALA